MTFIPWGPWEPDVAGVDSGKLVTALNVYSATNGYSPIPALLPSGTDALPGRCVGASFYRTADGGFVLIAGTTTALYRLVGTSWTDYTRLSGGAYDVPESEYWSFAQFGTQLIALNFNDDPQVLDIDAGGTAFSALGGSPPKARYVKVFGDFVVLIALNGDERTMRWSGINDATQWTIGTSFCDEQEFPSGGNLSALAITGLSGGQMGWVFQEKTIRRMIFQPGADDAFRFEVVDEEHGSTAGYSVVTTANEVFFLSDDGFFSISEAGGLRAIGADRVNTWFHDNCDTQRLFSVISVAHPFKPIVMWAFYNTEGSTNFDRLIIFNWALDGGRGRWSYGDPEAQYWVAVGTPATTLEQLDVYGTIDSGDIPFPFDSRVWEGGQAVLSAINTDSTVSYLEGAVPLDVELSTALFRPLPGARARVGEGGVEPVGVFNDATLSVRVDKRENSKSSQNLTAASTPSTRTGVARVRASGRMLAFVLDVTQTTGTIWQSTQGLEVEFLADGSR